jgi:D-3-phosphoglycerate dehydrogenase / 2-oxoglutarate reductase
VAALDGGSPGVSARKKVFFVPHLLPHHRAVHEVLSAADDVEIVYGLDAETGWDRPADVVQQEALIAEWNRRLDEVLPGLHGLYASGGDTRLEVTAERLARAGNLEVSFQPGAGFNNVDLEAATAHGVAIVNAGGGNSTPVSDHAIGLMISCSMRIGLVDRCLHREKRWIRVVDLHKLGQSPVAISYKTVGLVGFGFIAREVARKCRDGFRMRVLAYDPFFDPVEADRQGVTLVDSLEEMIPECDFLSIHVPYTKATHHIVGERELSLMKPTSFLINTSRGGNVDQEALIRYCVAGRIAGAGIDVTDPEPLPAGHPLFDVETIIVSPHIAGGGDEYLGKMGELSATNALHVLRGKRPFHLLNPEVWPALQARQSANGNR